MARRDKFDRMVFGYRMTNRQLLMAVRKNKYILISDVRGRFIAVNCRALGLMLKKNPVLGRLGERTVFSSFVPCTFMDYITHKVAFI